MTRFVLDKAWFSQVLLDVFIIVPEFVLNMAGARHLLILLVYYLKRRHSSAHKKILLEYPFFVLRANYGGILLRSVPRVIGAC